MDGPLMDGSLWSPWIMVPDVPAIMVCLGQFSNRSSKFRLAEKKYLKTKKATISMEILVSIHGILDAESQELMVVHRKIAETKLQSRTTLFIKDDIE